MAIKMMMMIRKNNASLQLFETVLLAALLFFFLLAGVVNPISAVVHEHEEDVGQLEPAGVETQELIRPVASMRRLLAPFQLCLACKCCVPAADPATCSTMPCCFGIDCQLPNKPYGVCAFVPKTCSCTYCAI